MTVPRTSTVRGLGFTELALKPKPGTPKQERVRGHVRARVFVCVCVQDINKDVPELVQRPLGLRIFRFGVQGFTVQGEGLGGSGGFLVLRFGVVEVPD